MEEGTTMLDRHACAAAPSVAPRSAGPVAPA